MNNKHYKAKTCKAIAPPSNTKHIPPPTRATRVTHPHMLFKRIPSSTHPNTLTTQSTPPTTQTAILQQNPPHKNNPQPAPPQCS